MDKLIEQLRTEPALAWKMTVNVLGAGEDSPEARRAACEVREALLVRDLIAKCDRQHSPYKMNHRFVLLHYPCYWHYDILFALKVMAEAGFLGDPRCAAALDLLESKRLPEGGFPAEESYARPTRPQLSGYSPVN